MYIGYLLLILVSFFDIFFLGRIYIKVKIYFIIGIVIVVCVFFVFIIVFIMGGKIMFFEIVVISNDFFILVCFFNFFSLRVNMVVK